MSDKFPSYVKAYQYKGGFNKFVYDKLKELCDSSEEEEASISTLFNGGKFDIRRSGNELSFSLLEGMTSSIVYEETGDEKYPNKIVLVV